MTHFNWPRMVVGMASSFWRRNFFALLALTVLVLATPAGWAQPTVSTVIASNSMWRFFRGTNEASTPPTDWRTNTFDDSTWETGPAPFYYGSNYNPPSGTLLADMRSNYTCIFLRSTFVLTNAAQVIAMTNRLFIDDGFIAWINGVEVRRLTVAGNSNVFSPYTTNASSTNFQAALFQLNSAVNSLRIGTNVLAVQAFNVNITDVDFHVNPELTMSFADLSPPEVQSITPAPSSLVTNLAQLTVVFSEAVTNVQPANLLFNGVAATSVTTNGATNTYRFALPPAGLVTVTWSSAAAIKDFAGNVFAGTNIVWNYTNVIAPPYVVSAVPAFGATINSLTNITVVFNTPVSGLGLADFIVNGYNPTAVTGSGTTYTFTLPVISPGLIQVYWDVNQVITDAAGVRMVGASNTWTYGYADTLAPTITKLTPTANATLAAVTQLEVSFSEPVSGLDASDLLINSQPAASVFGSGAGPYIFQFPQPAVGPVQFAWAAGHNIRDLSITPNAFAGGSWTVNLNPTLFAGDVIINEFLAANILTNAPQDLDEDNELQDWIELYNRGTNAVRLLGWSLTTDAQVPGMWTFPDVSLGAGKYLLIYASAKDRSPTNGTKLHTNFKLNANGEYLALLSADSPRRVASEFAPAPEQRNDYSYGLTTNGWRYFQTPTPGTNNGNSPITQVIPKLHVNVDRGVFDLPFTLVVSCDTPGATLRYTTDGSQPTATTTNLYTGPLLITNTTIFRIAAYLTNLLPSRVSSHTYLFFDQVVKQPNNPAGYPSTWGTFGTFTAPADYEMDPEIVTNAAYASLIKPALLALPVLSIAATPDDLFGPTLGIYTHPEPADAVRAQWERPASVEMILTNGEPGFQADCGIRIQGNASRTPSKTPKHPMRLLFKGDYGEGKLKYQLYPDSPVDSFNSVVLRADFNNSWTHWDNNQRLRGSRIRDAWGKDTFRDMGQPGGHSRYFHLFLNGIYWGIYDCSERIDSDFAANYFGGDAADYDVMASKPTEAIDGNITAYNTMVSKVRTPDMRVLTNYTAALGQLDMTNFVDYMLLNMYGANQDWGYDGNWNALRYRPAGGLYKYITWDCEQLVVNNADNRVAVVTDLPSGFHSNLVNSAEYRLFFADRVQRHMFNGGALTTNQLIPRWNYRANTLATAITAESARWGDYERDVVQGVTGSSSTAPFLLYTRNDHWLPEWGRMITNYFPARGAIALAQFVTAGLFPTVSAPTFSQFGGRIPANFLLTMAASNTIYFTTNGLDPRVYGTGATASVARAYSVPFGMASSMTVKARAVFGTNWSPLVEASFGLTNLIPQIRITEIMYNPVGGDAYEYLELQNVGATTLDLGNYSFTGISFAFPFGFSFPAGQRLVLGNIFNTNAFKLRYPGVTAAGWYGGSLANNGETITLLDGTGRTVLSISYDDKNGWPTAADGGGYSLEIIDVNGDPDAAANWRAGSAQNGTPGQPNSVPPGGSVVLNELMAENLFAVANGGTYPDWVELYNSSGGSVDLGNWSLTDDGNARKFVFTNGTVIPSGGYLVVWCDAVTNATPGIHTGFSLSRNGDDVLLYDPSTNRVDAISFGPQVANLSIGRVGSSWTLTTPTPNTVNVAALLAAPTNLFINEWLANSAPGFDDWIELYNAATNAVALRGLHFGTTNDLFQLRSLSFVAPRGYVQLIANAGPGADHIDFKLPASAGAIILYDTGGGELQRVTYGAQAEGITQGRLPDGGASIVSFPGSASPGTTNYLFNYNGPVLNELLAHNSSAVLGPWGDYPDYLELFNPTTNAFDLGGLGLSDDASKVKFTFAPGTVLASNGYLVVWCDGGRAASAAPPLNSGFSLSGSSGGAYLLNALGQVVSSVDYGFQVTDLPIGLSGGQWRLLASATPGSNNAPVAALGSAANLRINEWMANAANGGNDWFELYNSDALPVSLSGLFLTDDLSVAGVSNTPIAALSFIGGKDWVKWIADQDPSQGRDHARFDLDSDGDNIRLYATNLAIIDTVSFGSQSNGVSQGRLPDGGTSIVSFPTTPTPEESNYLPLSGLVVNEVLTHTDPPLEDGIEFQNTGTNTLDVSGWWISNSQRDLKKFRVAAGTTLVPGAFRVFYENQFNADGSGMGTNFTLNSAHGDAVYLAAADGAGELTGYRVGVSFGAAENGVSFGRFTTSTGMDFTAMAARSFGSDNPATLAQFRTGLGLTNSYPKVGPVIINEIMYHPVSGTNAVEIAEEEFVELHNVTAAPVPMFDPVYPANVWRLSGGITFNFSANHTIAANGYLVLVSFDPATNAAALAAFQAKYGSVTFAGPYQGHLDNTGEALELSRPDAPQQAPHPDAGYVPSVLVDHVVYAETAPWPTAADGGGASLQRLADSLYGNEALNWKAEPPTAGRTNTAGALVAPTIVEPPTNQTVIAGNTATFTVVVNGSVPLAYQWQHAGTNLPGATTVSLDVVNAQSADAGSYRVIVSNAADTITSQSATLTVLVPPSISVPPPSQTVIAGNTAQFNATAAGTAPLHYQWRFNGMDLPGQDSTPLNLPNIQPAGAGNYTVVITNSAGAITSAVAVLTVIIPPSITSDPNGLTVLENATATFTVSATGTAPLAYQWQKDGLNLPGANGASFTIPAAQVSDEGGYSVIVTNLGGAAFSAVAQLQVSVAPFLTAPSRRGDGAFEFTLNGRTNRNYTVEFSVSFAGWTNVTNILLTSPQTPVVDVASTNSASRFYRVRMEP